MKKQHGMKTQLEQAISLVDRFESRDASDEQDRKDSLTLLKSLQPKVPYYVAEWYEDKIAKYSIYNIVRDIFTLNASEKIFDWLVVNHLSTPDDVTRFLVYMQTFGYVVVNDDKCVVRVTLGFGGDSGYLAYNDELKVYHLTADSKEAVRLSFDNAEKIAVLFKMDYELIEV